MHAVLVNGIAGILYSNEIINKIIIKYFDVFHNLSIQIGF